MSAAGLVRGALLGSRLCAASSSALAPQRRSIVHKSCLDLNPETTPPPWDYKKLGYSDLHAAWDGTKKRFNQNSKLVVVEGNIGSGKSTFAKELADQFGMLHMPEFKMDDILIDQYGIDLRDHYHDIPERFRMPDIKMFYADPASPMTTVMQDRIYFCRYEQYCNALAHILNTGQGVVLERSPQSDFVFVNAMRQKNYIGLPFLRYYYLKRKLSIDKLYLRPHLVIYLDTPAEQCLENIKKRGNDHEVNSDVIDLDYLKTMEDSYRDYMKEAERKSYTAVYDWKQAADTDSIVEDIERIDLDFYERHRGRAPNGENELLEEWAAIEANGPWSWNLWRNHFTEKYMLTTPLSYVPKHEVEELYCSNDDFYQFVAVMKQKVLKSRYSYGYIRERGDSIFNSGLFCVRQGTNMPDPWYDYYYRMSYYEDYFHWRMFADSTTGEREYNPGYHSH